MATDALPPLLELLREPFPASQVKKNQNKMHYVDIAGYINRALDVLGMAYDFTIDQSELELLPGEMKTSSGKRQYLAQVRGTVRVFAPEGSASRSGVGADVSFDPDKAIKTAQAEAFKKAMHQFGVALELWDEERRDEIDRQQRLAGGSEAALKQESFRIAKERLGKDKPTVAEVAKLFGVKPGEMADPDVLRRILVEEGVL